MQLNWVAEIDRSKIMQRGRKPVMAAGREGKLGVVGAPADEAESGHTGKKASTLC